MKIAVQYTPVRLGRGRLTHANAIFDPHATQCGKKLAGKRVVISIDKPLDCAKCMARLVRDRRASIVK